jgi:hypothetical protein
MTGVDAVATDRLARELSSGPAAGPWRAPAERGR